MSFIPHTDADVAEMLQRIGVDDIEALFDEIPPELRIKGLDAIGPALTEAEISRLMQQRARGDGEPEHHRTASRQSGWAGRGRRSDRKRATSQVTGPGGWGGPNAGVGRPWVAQASA